MRQPRTMIYTVYQVYNSVEEILEELKEEACTFMYNKTFYYNKYSASVYNGVHYENHRVALFHHLLDIKMLLLNRGVYLASDDDDCNLPFIEAVVVDTIPVKFGVDDKLKMVKEHAKTHGVGINKATTMYVALIGILSDNIGLSTLVFTGWFRTRNSTTHYMVVSEMT